MSKDESSRTVIGSIILRNGTCSTRQLDIYDKKKFESYISDCNNCNTVSLYDTRDGYSGKEYIESVSKYLFVTDEEDDDINPTTCLYAYNGKGGFSFIESVVGPRGYSIDYLIFRHCELFGLSDIERTELLLKAENYLKGKTIVFVNENLYRCSGSSKRFNAGISFSKNIFFCFNNSSIKEIVEAYVDEFHPTCFCVDNCSPGEWIVIGETVSQKTKDPTSVIEEYM